MKRILISGGYKTKDPAENCRVFAERRRFELLVHGNVYGSLANCWFQPLTHLSIPRVSFVLNAKRDCKYTIKFCFATKKGRHLVMAAHLFDADKYYLKSANSMSLAARALRAEFLDAISRYFLTSSALPRRAEATALMYEP